MNKKKMKISFPQLLAILFIGLKLTGYINWSWVWVLSPIWITFLIAFLFLVIGGAINATIKKL
jgi:uncharacterized protein (DUF983 family)